jgi:hypothetical protein
MKPRKDDPNPGFTFFANDVLAWEPLLFLTDAQLGQAFKLIVYGCKNGSELPADHPMLANLDAKVVALCTKPEGDHLAVIKPCDLPRLMLDRQRYLDARRNAGSKGGRKRMKGAERDAHGRLVGGGENA